MVDYLDLSTSIIDASGSSSSLSGTLGYMVDGVFRVVDPDDPRRFFVRFPNGNFVSALHFNRVPQKKNQPVLVGYDGIGRPVILGEDPTRSPAFQSEVSSGSSVGFHSHVRGSGMEFIIDPWMLKPLRVTVFSGTTLTVSAGWYLYDGKLRYYAGGTLDIASYITSTANYQNWVKVGINPITETLVAVAGTASYGSDFAPDSALIEDIVFEELDYVLLVAVWVNNGQTTLYNYEIVDMRFPPVQASAAGTGAGRTEPLTFDGEILFMGGDVLMIGV